MYGMYLQRHLNMHSGYIILKVTLPKTVFFTGVSEIIFLIRLHG